MFSEAVGLERGPLNLMSINEELLERKSSGSGLETEVHALTFAVKSRSLSRYSLLADQKKSCFFFFFFFFSF
jgi:hypothetical protein